VAWLLRGSSWYVVLGAAYLVGAFADHALFVMIHECAHNLLFKKKSHNTFAAILSNLPRYFPVPFHFKDITSSIIRSRVYMNWTPIFRINTKRNSSTTTL
jgi:hypothetical protein